MLLEKRLGDVVADDVWGLVHAQIGEGISLEFKRELKLDSPSDKREVAKDVSALANTAGGRILYGIKEKRLKDRSVVAAGVNPVADGGVGSRLSDVLHSGIHPRPHFDIRHVPVDDGFVVIVEVYPSSRTDLHMVSGYDEGRFYHRGPHGNVLMTEPEIREAYFRIGESRASLDARFQSITGKELSDRAGTDESFLMAPLFAGPSLVHPGQVRDLGQDLHKGALTTLPLGQQVGQLRLEHDGYRSTTGGPQVPSAYLAVLKNGVVHLSKSAALTRTEHQSPSMRGSFRLSSWRPADAVRTILAGLILANDVLALAGYDGPVRLLYQIRPQGRWVVGPPAAFREADDAISPGPYGGSVQECILSRSLGSWGRLIKELVDPIHHAWGEFECPLFTPEGVLRKEHGSSFPDVFDQYLEIER